MRTSGQKRRVDRLIVERGLAESRQKAAAILMAGQVIVDGARIEKPGKLVPIDCEIDVRRSRSGFVSRGGEKLSAALAHFNLDVQGKVCMDIGASTGGFTDCLLAHGARLVYAVDVGYGQLAGPLRDRPDVVVLERTNIRYLKIERLDEIPSVATIDVSFISLRLVLPRARELLSDDADVVALIKPQFEVGKGKVGKGGIVKDPTLHRSVLEEIVGFSVQMGLLPLGVFPSPLAGARGNQEYFLHARREDLHTVVDPSKMIENAISRAAEGGGV